MKYKNLRLIGEKWRKSLMTINHNNTDLNKKFYLIYAYTVGLYEGYGYFSIGEYLTYELGIELSIRVGSAS